MALRVGVLRERVDALRVVDAHARRPTASLERLISTSGASCGLDGGEPLLRHARRAQHDAVAAVPDIEGDLRLVVAVLGGVGDENPVPIARGGLRERGEHLLERGVREVRDDEGDGAGAAEREAPARAGSGGSRARRGGRTRSATAGSPTKRSFMTLDTVAGETPAAVRPRRSSCRRCACPLTHPSGPPYPPAGARGD